MPVPSLPDPKAPNNWLVDYTPGTTLTGNSSKDNQLSAAASKITLVGGTNGNNTFIVYDATDKIVQAASSNANTVETWGSGYQLPVNVQNLVLEGSSAAYATGNGGNNLIKGNAGADTLTTDGGNDVLVAGTGVDTYVITEQASTTTWIEGFKSSDKLDLSQYFTSYAQFQAAESQVGADLKIDLGSGQSLMLASSTAASVTSANVETGVDTSGMQLTFDEEFDSATTSTTKATLTTSTYTWNTAYAGGVRWLSANNEQEVYVDPSYNHVGLSPFSDANGILAIKASPTPTADLAKLNNQPYMSGVLTTQSSHAQEYGYFEASIEVPAGQGLWPAFWLLPTSQTWPPEVDIMEQIGSASTMTTSTTHSSVSGNSSTATFFPEDLSAGFHTYAMNWTATTMTFYVDGQETKQIATPADFHQPMYMILNLAVGGNWPGLPNTTTNWATAEMQVDYVRAYSAAPASVAGGTSSDSSAPTVVLSNAMDASDLSNGITTTSSQTLSASALGLNTSVTVAYDAADGVTITNNGSWNAIKNVTVTRGSAADVSISNFVDAEIDLGDGESTVNVSGIKRGDITVGDGNSVITVTGNSNSPSNNGVAINVGAGANWINFSGGVNDEATINVGNGNNTVVIAGQAQAAITLGSGKDVLSFQAGVTATVSDFDLNNDDIHLHNVAPTAVYVTSTTSETDIHLGTTGLIRLAGVTATATKLSAAISAFSASGAMIDSQTVASDLVQASTLAASTGHT